MNIELPPQYDPKSVESAIYKKWLEARVFHATPDAPGTSPKRPAFSIVIPPPNVTGALHLGHAINGTIQDILTRYHRMKGDNTMWLPGIDHAGIATQAVVEKTIFEKEKKNRHDLGREELVRRIWEWKEQYGTRILSQLQSIGVSCDWDRTRFTLDEVCAKAVREAFFKMFKDGLIFRGKRLVNWDTHLQTAVADDEIYHEPVKGQMTSIKYPVEGLGVRGQGLEEYLIVATTRPETMLGDTAVAVHPDDPRYKHLIGKHVILPLVGRRIPIIADGLLVDPKFGTGVVKVTPAHDPNDYATGVRHNLEQINLLTPDGKVNENGQSIEGGFNGVKYSYVGMKFATEARKRVLADLEGLGLIADKKPHDHEVGHSDRSKTPIEPYLSDQWFVRMGDIEETRNAKGETRNDAGGVTLANGQRVSGLAQAAMDAVTDGRVKITPERYAKGYLDWLGQKRDWCISRQLWWGHRIPVWRQVREPKPWSDPAHEPRQWWAGEANARSHEIALAPDPNSHAGFFVCLRDPDTSLERILGEMGFEQDPDVLDTWFSSALWPLSTMGWPAAGTSDKADDVLLPTFYPTSVLSTARDILTLWVARMVMFGLYCRGDVPFHNVYVHPVIQDGEGKIMSKSKGNGVDPVDIIGSHGADALRFTLASLATETQDIRMPVVKDPKTGVNTSPKFDIGRNFANKIWNASRYVLGVIETGTKNPPFNWGFKVELLEDRWILSRLNSTIEQTTESINGCRFAEMAEVLRSFFWTDLCDWYLEIAKGRIRSGDTTVQVVLLHCLETSLKLLHPVMPFITEEIWGKMKSVRGDGAENWRDGPFIGAPAIEERDGGTWCYAPWPVRDPARADAAAEAQIGLIQAVVSAIREIQNRYPTAKGKPTILRPRDRATQSLLEHSRGIIGSLAATTLSDISMSATKPDDAATAVLPDAEVYVAGVIDKDAEAKKLAKRREELQKFIASNTAKLSNEGFTAKAPAKVVQGLRDQLAQQQTELAAVEKNLAELSGPH